MNPAPIVAVLGHALPHGIVEIVRAASRPPLPRDPSEGSPHEEARTAP